MILLIQPNRKDSGFSLVEITIVMVVLSLMIGGIILASNMIYASQIRGAQSDIAKISSAVITFKTKMGGLPGDFNKASQFWPTATNGNGNGKIGFNADGSLSEEYYAWQHLSLAQLIDSAHTATSTRDVPASTINGGYYRMSYQTNVYRTTGHLISLNAMNSTYSTAHQALMKPIDVYDMDVKSDDGEADSGSIMGFNAQGVPGCVTNDYTVGSGDYVTTVDDIKCKVFFAVGL